jgi:hypothetical protein
VEALSSNPSTSKNKTKQKNLEHINLLLCSLPFSLTLQWTLAHAMKYFSVFTAAESHPWEFPDAFPMGGKGFERRCSVDTKLLRIWVPGGWSLYSQVARESEREMRTTSHRPTPWSNSPEWDFRVQNTTSKLKDPK